MAKGKTTKLTWFVTVGIIGFVAICGWSLFLPHSHEPYHVEAADIQAMTSVPVPAGAHDFRLASFQHFQQSLEYARFEAPPDICLKYAALVVGGAKLVEADEFDLKNGARLSRPDAFRDFTWFDLANAKNVVTSGGGPMLPQVWVDQARGVFYYRKTD